MRDGVMNRLGKGSTAGNSQRLNWHEDFLTQLAGELYRIG
jgi:hypothetical protein